MTGGWLLRMSGSPTQSPYATNMRVCEGTRRQFVESVNHEPSSRLTVEEELMLYTRLLDRYPDFCELRKYRGYCLIQLGRWQEARVEFELLLQRGWLNIYSMSPGALLSLFFESGIVRSRKSGRSQAACVRLFRYIRASVNDHRGDVGRSRWSLGGRRL